MVANKFPWESTPHTYQKEDYYKPVYINNPHVGPDGVIDTGITWPIYRSSGIEESEIVEIIPGETDIPAAEFVVGSFVELCCPICQSPMTAKLVSTSVNFDQELTKQEYSVTDKPCDCPFIVLECLPFRGGIKW